jgi:LruC domain-containing protein
MTKNTTTAGSELGLPPLIFEWENSKIIKLSVGISAISNPNEKHIIVVYTANPNLGGKLITSGTASTTKNFETQFSLALFYSSVFVQEIVPGFGIYGQNILVNNALVNVKFNSSNNGLGKTGNNFIPPQTDSDNDLVPDSVDQYPYDSAKAYNNYYPFENSKATLAFEDLWPHLGDYDLNDVVVSYKYNIVTNASNRVVQILANYSLLATGGSYKNGFGVEFPINRNQIDQLVGAGLESGQSKAVIILFNNMRNEMNTYNTVTSQIISDSVNYNVSFNILNGPLLNDFGLSAYNPFIWNNSTGFGRGYEVHLPNNLPTNLANLNLFGTYSDNSSLVLGKYYISKTNEMPWALNIPAPFNYPKEKSKINEAYLKFNAWVQSCGVQSSDWYLNKSGYRNTNNIFVRP